MSINLMTLKVMGYWGGRKRTRDVKEGREWGGGDEWWEAGSYACDLFLFYSALAKDLSISLEKIIFSPLFFFPSSFFPILFWHIRPAIGARCVSLSCHPRIDWPILLFTMRMVKVFFFYFTPALFTLLLPPCLPPGRHPIHFIRPNTFGSSSPSSDILVPSRLV